ncbi:MAG: PHP domain-containing protein [Spirochaetia bacterium]
MDRLNSPRMEDRLSGLRSLAAARRPPAVRRQKQEVNCHVHTFYSFSPYSPAAAAARAQEAGLAAVGIMDHDSMAGAREMREAGAILGIATTAGVELRVSAAGTSLAGRRINNPDSLGVLYVIIHGVPARSVASVQEFLRPIQAAREVRGRRMVEDLNALLTGYGLRALDWHRDVRSLSRADDGGTITERHILFAVASAIVEKTGRGPALREFLRTAVGIHPPARVADYLADPSNEMLLYDLLGVLKSSFIEKVYIQPDARECIPVRDVVRFAEESGGIPTYPYLGDVTDSPTGDKKAESFEDGYLDELMDEVKRLGFRAVAYMPPRNTIAQLRRVQELCARHGFMEISGVDINSPRQSFNCPELALPEFSHLVSATWALIAHEKLSDAAPRYGLFHPDNPLAHLPLAQRTAAYAEVGRTLDPTDLRPVVKHPLVASWGGRTG